MLTLKCVIAWFSGCFCCKRVVNRSFLILFCRIILYVYVLQYSLTPTQLNGKMTGAFSASDIQSAVASGVRGGWKRIGDIVFVDVKFNLVASYKDAAIMKNLPVPRNDNTAFSAANLSAGRVAYGRVNSNGDLEWHDSQAPATGNECSITGIYNCV